MKQNLSWKVWTISSPCLWHIIDILSTKSLLLPLPQRYYSYVYFIYGYVYFTFIRLLISNSFIKHNVFFSFCPQSILHFKIYNKVSNVEILNQN